MATVLLLLAFFISPVQDEAKGARPETAAEWVAILGTAEEATRFEALNALIALGSNSVAPCLALLNDVTETPLRRWQAAKILGKTGDADTIADLLRVVKEDPASTVGRVATEAAERLIESELEGENQRASRELLAELNARVKVPGTTSAWRQPPIATGTPFVEALPWADDLESALKLAEVENKLVLATVVAVSDRRWSSGFREAPAVWNGEKPPRFGDERSQAMDAGLVKERALMGSLFSDPEIAHWIRERFVPVRIRAHTFHFDGQGPHPDPLAAMGISGEELGGTSLVFVRPNGEVVHALRRIGVMSVPMVRALLPETLRIAGLSPLNTFAREESPALDSAWAAVRDGDLPAARQWLQKLGQSGSVRSAEALYLRGHVASAFGEDEEARELWRAASELDPEGAFGGKAALRLQERGVQIVEWETMERFDSPRAPSTTELGSERSVDLEHAVAGAVRFLLAHERAGGEWRDPFYDITEGSGPGSRYDMTLPRTALVTDALMQASRLPLGSALEDAAAAAAARGVARVGAFADSPSPFVWHLTYALHLQVAILKARRDDAEVAAKRARALIESLAEIQSEGGWSYMNAPRIHSFNTAPVLLLLAEAEALGVEIPEGMSLAAAQFLESLREEEDGRNFAYAPTMRFPLRASSCRTALCELALAEFSGKPRRDAIAQGVALLFEHDGGVRATTKVYESYFSNRSLQDAYHYYFGHYYAARSLVHLSRSKARTFAKQHIQILLSQRELDGSFVDAEMQGKCYSTAMALLTLLEARQRRR
ncbi:MAG: HEAT repeat domain-containing protein [Planctomycetota bacterium]